MAWIESHQGLARHIKTKRLARKLKISIPTTVGHLHLLWWWAMDNLPDGRLTALEPEDIADEMMWDGDAKELIAALHDTGFVDKEGEDYYIHDWHDYIGRLLERRKKETDRKREYRSKSKVVTEENHDTSHVRPAGHDEDDTRDGGGNSTVPYLTVPKEIKHIVDSNECDLMFEQFYSIYTPKQGSVRKEALKSWTKLWKEKKISPLNIGLVIESAMSYIAYQNKNNYKVCGAQVFLNQERWMDKWEISNQRESATAKQYPDIPEDDLLEAKYAQLAENARSTRGSIGNSAQ